MNYIVKMASCGETHIPSFMKTGTDVQDVLRFCLNRLRRCNGRIADGTDLWTITLKVP
jgi:hypothetical protein